MKIKRVFGSFLIRNIQLMISWFRNFKHNKLMYLLFKSAILIISMYYTKKNIWNLLLVEFMITYQ